MGAVSDVVITGFTLGLVYFAMVDFSAVER
jgi:hypothetical protein